MGKLDSRIDRLEASAGIRPERPVLVLILNDGETREQAWKNAGGVGPFPSQEELAERFNASIIIDLSGK